MRRTARLEQIYPVVGYHAPVVMFARTIHAGERFFVQQAYHIMSQCHLLHRFHNELIVVCRHVDGREHGSKLILRGRYFVMLRFGRYAELPQLDIQVVHIRGYSFVQSAEIMVAHFLSSWRRRSEQRSAREHNIKPFFSQLFVNQKVFLFRPQCCRYAF